MIFTCEQVDAIKQKHIDGASHDQHKLFSGLHLWQACACAQVRSSEHDVPKVLAFPSFRMKHVEIFKILESVCGTFESKWTLLQSRDEFIAEHATAIRCHRRTNIIALLNSSEPKAGSIKHMMDALSC